MKTPRKSETSPLKKLEALDLSILSEEERVSAIAEVRSLIVEVSSDKRPDAPVFERKLALLRLWQRLVQLRIADVKDERPPPDVKPLAERMFPPEVKPEPAPEAAATTEVVPTPPPAPKRKAASVAVKLSEEAVIKGKTYAAEEIVHVSRNEADGLVEGGKGTVVDEIAKPQASGETDVVTPET